MIAGIRRGWILAAIAAGGLAATAERARADFVFSMAQVGSDVVLTGQGSMYVNELFNDMLPEPTLIRPQVNPGAPSVSLSVLTLDTVDAYTIILGEPDLPFTITGPNNFGTGGAGNGAEGGSSDSFGFGFAGSGSDRRFSIFVPQGYAGSTLPALLENSTTFFNQTYASLGIAPGSYSWTMTSALEPLTESISLTVAPAPIPLPPTALLLAGGLVALAALRRRPARG